MLEEDKQLICKLREENWGYGAIAKKVGKSKSTIKDFCKRNNLNGFRACEPNNSIEHKPKVRKCQKCGADITVPKLRLCNNCRVVKTPHTLEVIKCCTCGELFLQTKYNQKYCSKECKYPSVSIHEQRYCKRCGEVFTSRNNKQIFCSRKCGKAFRGLGRKYTLRKDERLQQAVKYDKSVNLHTLIKRDNNICQICKRVCDLYDYEVSVKGAILCGDFYPTIDHIYPCSKGGKHTWDNVQLACLKCNREKSDK